MRILFLSASSGSRGGGELYLIYIAKELNSRGHTVGLWCSQHPRMDELAAKFEEFGKVIRSNYVNTYDHLARSLSYLIPFTSQSFHSEWSSFQPDIIHLNKQNLEDGLDLLNFLNQFPCPSVANIHITKTQTSLGSFLGKWRDWTAKKYLREFQGKIIATSQTCGNDLFNFLSLTPSNKDKMEIVENGVTIPSETERYTKREKTRAILGLSENTLLVVAVGRMEEQKQPILYLEWAKYLQQIITDIYFVWVGDGQLRTDWEEWIKQHNITNIKLLGWQQDVTGFLAAADIFFHPARFEGFPFALLEAMSWSIPCVVTASLAEYLQLPSQCYLKVQELDGNYQSLKALADSHLRSSIAHAGHELIQQKFSTGRMIDEYEALYRKMIASYSSPLSHS